MGYVNWVRGTLQTEAVDAGVSQAHSLLFK